MRTITQFIAIIGVLISIAWLIFKPGFDSTLSIFSFVLIFLSSYLMPKANKKQTVQKMNVSNNSSGIQAGRDINK